MEEGGIGKPAGAASSQHSAECLRPVFPVAAGSLVVFSTPSMGKHSQNGLLGGQ